MRQLKNRRGVTLVLMAFMMTVLIGAAAFAVDFSKLMLFRTQLSAASDAAALAGVYQVLHKQPTNAVAEAQYYAALHRVGPTTVTLAGGDVTGGSWDLNTRTFTQITPPGDWTDPALDAVRVVSHYDAPYGFGRLFGLNSHTVRDTAIAVMGYVGVTTCVRPIALPLQALLNQLYGTDAAGNPNVLVANHPALTTDDVNKLKAANIADTVALKLGSSSEQGNFYIVNLGPYSHADKVPLSPSPNFGGMNIFTDRFGGDCSNSPWEIGPGDWLEGKTGDADGPTRSGYGQLCGINGVGNGASPCPTQDSIKIAVWDTEDDAVCTPRCFHVSFIGIFIVVDFLKTSGANPFEGVVGYFAAMPSSGALTNIPTPIQKIGLVY